MHSELGPGLLESAYAACLEVALRDRSLGVRADVEVPLAFRGVAIGTANRLDLLVEEKVIVEVTSVAALDPLHEAQLLMDEPITRVAFLRDGSVPSVPPW